MILRELRKKEKKALKANCDEQMRENVETGRYKRPVEYNMESVATSRPREI